MLFILKNMNTLLRAVKLTPTSTHCLQTTISLLCRGAALTRFRDKAVLVQKPLWVCKGSRENVRRFHLSSASPGRAVGKNSHILYGKRWSTDCKHPHLTEFPVWFLWFIECVSVSVSSLNADAQTPYQPFKPPSVTPSHFLTPTLCIVATVSNKGISAWFTSQKGAEKINYISSNRPVAWQKEWAR